MNKLQELNKWFKLVINDIERSHEPEVKQMGNLKFAVVGDEVEFYLIISLIHEKSVYNLYSFEIGQKTDIKEHLMRALNQAMAHINLNSIFGAELEVIGKLLITYH
jgi:hypothetical protein